MRHIFLSLSTRIINSLLMSVIVAIGVHHVLLDGLPVVRIKMKKIRGFNRSAVVQCVEVFFVF